MNCTPKSFIMMIKTFLAKQWLYTSLYKVTSDQKSRSKSKQKQNAFYLQRNSSKWKITSIWSSPKGQPNWSSHASPKREVTGSILPEALGVRSVMTEGCDPRDQPQKIRGRSLHPLTTDVRKPPRKKTSSWFDPRQNNLDYQ